MSEQEPETTAERVAEAASQAAQDAVEECETAEQAQQAEQTAATAITVSELAAETSQVAEESAILAGALAGEAEETANAAVDIATETASVAQTIVYATQEAFTGLEQRIAALESRPHLLHEAPERPVEPEGEPETIPVRKHTEGEGGDSGGRRKRHRFGSGR